MTSYGLPPRTSLPPSTAYPGAHNTTAATTITQVPEGKYTTTIYSYIRDGRHHDVIKILANELVVSPESRPVLSLLGYCWFMVGGFAEAAECRCHGAGWMYTTQMLTFRFDHRCSYEQLARLYPEFEHYRVYHAQSLYKAGLYEDAQRSSALIETAENSDKAVKLQAAIKYATNDLTGCKFLIDSLPASDTDTVINKACLLFKEGKYDEACTAYMDALKIVGYTAELSYNVALCYYMQKQFVPALKYIAEIIEKGIRDHPVEAAREALTDMPPRNESELDPVTLHNTALMNMDEDPTGGFEKLNFLLQQVPNPPQEAFANLLLLYVKYEYLDLAADLLAENRGVAEGYLDPNVYGFIEASLLRQSSAEEAYNKFDDLANRQADILRKLTKQVQEARANHDEDAVKRIVNEYDDAVERYIPLVMSQSRIYWDRANYAMVEKIFRKSVEFCNEHEVWKLNVAHVLFMQETKYKEAISFYEPIVRKGYDNILNVTAIVLANLCVSYIMTSQNEEAEDLMRKIEKEEERTSLPADPRTYHLCIVNLVIGTLYCAKGNYEFGITRVMKSLEPFNKKLGTDTWYYAKRCFASLFEMLAKHMILLKDSVFTEILAFFDACELHGRNIPAGGGGVGGAGVVGGKEEGKRRNGNVSSEARLLKSLFLRLYA
ncbi:uncharacterized protein EV422DRAFT_496510 [Fimicolochytrium jonesii]|uniref:uncharacterized protein n=1 Tax=Fimicolochytrium jonesii TaxID=1396493 RepID=UPI0022FE1BF0|nr:uncharacterized protein EV422DRAFT_496510 [Fimicolochytrium jonesii]KAI8820793.1 hypothetical protein EV422DRAFT_496510 [Fimicolochytrium jonesii]